MSKNVFPGLRDIIDHLPLQPFEGRLTWLFDKIVSINMEGASRDLEKALSAVAEAANALVEQRLKDGEDLLRKQGVIAYLEAIAEHRPEAAFKPDFADLAYLYSHITSCKPGRVLEFGSGWSTYVIAKALAENGQGTVVSLECDADWARTNRQALPPELSGLCEILHVPTHPCDIEGEKGWCHDNLPDGDFDFVFLDGPVLTADRPMALDLLKCEEHLPPGAVIAVDGRIQNVLALGRRLPETWTAEAESLIIQWGGERPPDSASFLSVFSKGKAAA